MRRPRASEVATALAVAAVVAVAVAAVVDAVRPDPPATLDQEAAALLAGFGVAGVLVYSDPSCGLHALSLPGLVEATLPDGLDVGCDISVSPDGRYVAAAGAAWSPDNSQYAICRGTRVDVVAAAGGSAHATYTGCAPAWQPDGMLTYARDGSIRQARLEEILVPRGEVARAALNHPNAPWYRHPVTLRLIRPEIEELRILDLAWLSQSEVAALIEVRYVDGLTDAETVVAGFHGGRIAWQKPYFGRLRRLVVGPGGDVLPEPAQRPFPLVTSRISLAGPFDWSPDGRHLAVATRASVFVVDLRLQRLVRIPVTARDLAWR